MKIKVMIVEDDRDLGHLLMQFLNLNGFETIRVFNGEEARYELSRRSFDILIIDVMMPREDGFVLAAKISHSHPALPFLFITARNNREDVIHGLELGADDYIIKPFDVTELILRVKNILKRTLKKQEVPEEDIQIGIFNFQPESLILQSQVSKIFLTEKEAQLLYYLYQHTNKLVKREDILGELWKDVDFFSGRSMDVFISRLRKYLSDDKTLRIENIRGIGYRFSRTIIN